MEYSCFKTLAHKHKSCGKKMRDKFRVGKKWGIPYDTKSGRKCCFFANYRECKGSKDLADSLPKTWIFAANDRTSFETRLRAKQCELCGTKEAKHYEIHHVHRVKDLKGKTPVERMMMAKRRKTIVLCRECHYKTHGKKTPNE
jgi:hypothetical protein